MHFACYCVVGGLRFLWGNSWAALEAHHSNHDVDTTEDTCNQGLPEYLHSSPQRSLVSRLLSRVGLSRRLCAKEDTLLRNKPSVLTHDAATGYANSAESAIPYLKTQSMGFSDQLKCGARALDLRLGYFYAKNDWIESERQRKFGDQELQFHHGQYIRDTVNVRQQIGDEVVGWSKENPNELVILLISHCKTGAPLKSNPDFDGDSAKCDAAFF